MLPDFTYQEVLGAIASIISIWGSVIYIRSILIGDTHPHLYTWLVFSILTGIAFIAQIVDNAGPGSWMMGFTFLSCSSIALLSLKYGEQTKTKSDKIALSFSLFAIVPWLLTKDPLLSVIMISLIDGVAMIPTIRKSWNKPYQENLTSFYIANFKNVIALIALTNFTLVTTLYMFSIMLANTTLIGVCHYRRKILPKSQSTSQNQ